MATPQDLTVFEHTVYSLAGVLSSFGMLFYSRTLPSLFSIQNGDTQELAVFEDTVYFLAGVLSSFGFVILQSHITCAPQHTKWRPVKI